MEFQQQQQHLIMDSDHHQRFQHDHLSPDYKDDHANLFDLSKNLEIQKSKNRLQQNRTQSNFMPSPKNQNQDNNERNLTAQHPSGTNMSQINQSLPYPYALPSHHSPFTQSRYQFFVNNNQPVKAQPTNKFYDTTFSKALLSHSTYDKHSKKMQKYAEELQRLKEGRRSPSDLIDEKSIMLKTQFTKSRQYSKQFHASERVSGILKTNKNLAERLFDIQVGKRYVRNRSLIHQNVVTPNLSPIGSLSLPYKKKQAEQIDSENVRVMKKILKADSVISQRRFEEEFVSHKKYKKLVKKSIKHGFDIDKMTDLKKKHFNHVESKTSSQLFPPIGDLDKRSKSQVQKQQHQRKFSFNRNQEGSKRYFDGSTQRGEHTIIEAADDEDYQEGFSDENQANGQQFDDNQLSKIRKKGGRKGRKKQVPPFLMVNSEEEFLHPGMLTKQPSPRGGIIPIVPYNQQPESSVQPTHFNFQSVQQNPKITFRQHKKSNFEKSLNETQQLYNQQAPTSLAISPALQNKLNKRSLRMKHQVMPEVPAVVSGVRNRAKQMSMTEQQVMHPLRSTFKDTSIQQFENANGSQKTINESTYLEDNDQQMNNDVQLRSKNKNYANNHDADSLISPPSKKESGEQEESQIGKSNQQQLPLQENKTPFTLEEDQ